MSFLLSCLALTQLTTAVSEVSFQRLEDTGVEGAVTLAFGAEDFRRLQEKQRLGTGFVLPRFPLPGGRESDLFLVPSSAMEVGAGAVVVHNDGSSTRLEPETVSFHGHLEGGGFVFLGMTKSSMLSFMDVGGANYVLSSKGSAAGTAALGRLAAANASGMVGRVEPGPALLPDEASWASTAQRLAGSNPQLRTVDVFVDADNAYLSRFASEQACVDYVHLLVSAISSVTRRDLGTVLRIPDGYLRIFTDTPPWGPSIVGSSFALLAYRNWSNSVDNPLGGLPRDVSVALTYPTFGSLTYTGSTCSSSAYSMCSGSGSFPSPLQHSDSGNFDPFFLAQCFGFLFGSPRAIDYNPPIECDDGTGPDLGTIMSRCYFPGSQPGGVGGGGISQVGMRYHPRAQDHLYSDLAGFPCVDTQPIVLADYDMDGAPDLDDYILLEGFLAQGFESRGVRETFDLDGDGDLDNDDLVELGNLIVPFPGPAAAVFQNGGGTNSACYTNVTPPLLGTTWTSSVFALGAGTPTVVFGYSLPHEGLFFPGGEILVRGQQRFVSIQFSDGFGGTHSFQVPNDTSIAGETAYVQGGWVQSGGILGLCNRLDVTVSFYQ